MQNKELLSHLQKLMIQLQQLQSLQVSQIQMTPSKPTDQSKVHTIVPDLTPPITDSNTSEPSTSEVQLIDDIPVQQFDASSSPDKSVLTMNVTDDLPTLDEAFIPQISQDEAIVDTAFVPQSDQSNIELAFVPQKTENEAFLPQEQENIDKAFLPLVSQDQANLDAAFTPIEPNTVSVIS